MVAGLLKHGSTLLLIKDTKGHVFGGFASHSWEVKPQFQGEILSLFKSCIFFLLLLGEQGVLFIGFLAVGFTTHLTWSLVLSHFFRHRRMFIQFASYVRLHGINWNSSLLLKSRLNICCNVASLNANCCNCHSDLHHVYLCVCVIAGDSRCFLFTVFPTLRVYTTTGYNEHFMYLNQNQQTMPNGLVRQQSYESTVQIWLYKML